MYNSSNLFTAFNFQHSTNNQSTSRKKTKNLVLIIFASSLLLAYLFIANKSSTLQATLPDNATAPQDSSGHAFGSEGFNKLLAKQVDSRATQAQTNNDGSISLKSPLQNVDALITQNKVTFISSSNTEGGGQFSLSLQRWGRVDKTNNLPLQNTKIAKLYQQNGYVYKTYENGLTEQFISTANGIQQNFIVDKKPAGKGDLVFYIAVEDASLSQKDNGVKVTLNGSKRELTYDRLKVFDNNGKRFDARMEIVENQLLAIHINDDGAQYPLTIDPTIGDESWVSMGSLAGTNGSVYAILASGSDLYIGGSFNKVGTLSANNIAKWNGSNWSALGGGVTDGPVLTTNGSPIKTVYALALDNNGNLYIGGQFNEVDGQAASGIAQWNAASSSWNAMSSGIYLCQALAYDAANNTLYIGGKSEAGFGQFTGKVIQYDLTLDAASTIGAASGSPVGNSVRALAIGSNGLLYSAGAFANITKGNSVVVASNIAVWNGSSWSAMGAGTGGAGAGIVNALAWDNLKTLYVGGRFSSAGGVPGRYFIAQFDELSKLWSNLSFGLDGQGGSSSTSAGDVYALSWDDNAGILYVGGAFIQDAGRRVTMSYIGQWNGGGWSKVSASNTNPRGMNSVVKALAVDANGVLYAGGPFSMADTTSAKSIASWNGTAWSKMVAGGGVNAKVSASAWDSVNQRLFIAGDFTDIGGMSANRVAQWDGSRWSALGSGIPGSVYSLVWAASTNTLYAGSRGGVHKWDGSSWSTLTPEGSPVSRISALAWDNVKKELYVGGGTKFYAGEPVPATDIVSRWDGTGWSALGTGIKDQSIPNTTCCTGYKPTYVRALAWDDVNNDLYVSGEFIEAGGVTVNSITKWDGTNWNALGTGANRISTLAWDSANGKLYATGGFSDSNGVLSVSGIAMWDGTDWNVIGTDPIGAAAILWDEANGELIVGGYFNTKANEPAPVDYIGKWNGSSWEPIGSGTNGKVTTLSLDSVNGSLYVGGWFSEAGDKSSPYIARVDYPDTAIDLTLSNINNIANPLSPGEDARFDITLANLSSLAASSGIELTITYDVQFSLNTAGNTDPNCREVLSGETLCTIAPMAGNASVNLRVDFTSTASIPVADYTFDFSVAATGTDVETKTGNNTASEITTITVAANNGGGGVANNGGGDGGGGVVDNGGGGGSSGCSLTVGGKSEIDPVLPLLLLWSLLYVLRHRCVLKSKQS